MHIFFYLHYLLRNQTIYLYLIVIIIRKLVCKRHKCSAYYLFLELYLGIAFL